MLYLPYLEGVCVCVCIYIYAHIHIHTHILEDVIHI